MGLHTGSQFPVFLQLNASDRSEYVLGESAVTGGRLGSAKGHFFHLFIIESRGTQIPCFVNLVGHISPLAPILFVPDALSRFAPPIGASVSPTGLHDRAFEDNP